MLTELGFHKTASEYRTRADNAGRGALIGGGVTGAAALGFGAHTAIKHKDLLLASMSTQTKHPRKLLAASILGIGALGAGPGGIIGAGIGSAFNPNK